MKSPVNKEAYNFEKYVSKDRWMSYYYQISLIRKLRPKNILEIGVGNNFLKKLLSEEINYKTMDIAEDLKPDYMSSVDNIPLKGNSFDLVCAFQVLEHLPFNKFEQCLREMSRVSKKNIVISLPYSHIHYYLKIKIPFIRPFYISLVIPLFFKKWKFDRIHYWEIGAKGYPFQKIKKIMSKYFKIKKVLNPHENKYHIFFVLEKR